MVRNVVKPTLTVWRPKQGTANGTAILIAPGGGFRFLTWDNEGTDVAEWLAARGVTAFVLRYRLVRMPAQPDEFKKAMVAFLASFREVTANGKRPKRFVEVFPDAESRHIRALAGADVRQAIRRIRENAAEWGISRDRIGTLGISAGGFLTLDAILEGDAASRPSFAGQIYGGEVGGRSIPANAPPLFIVAAQDDDWMARISAQLYQDWSSAGLPAELHMFARGGHGFGMTQQGLPVDHWIELLGNWLGSLGMLERDDGR